MTDDPGRPGRAAEDGSPYPDRASPTFERDVRRMFTHIAGRYEWFDHLASVGNDFLWRPMSLWALDRFRADRPVRRVLHVGCGTGEFSRWALRHYPESTVVSADFTGAMVARARALAGKLAPRTTAVRATVRRLPFADGSFDLVLNAFVVRNLTDLDGSLAEMRRVLVDGGSLVTLEISEPPNRLVRSLFHAYFDHVVPWLGRSVHSSGPYRYLPESLRSLPAREEIVRRLGAAGFDPVRAVRFSQGIVTAYLARARGGSGPSR